MAIRFAIIAKVAQRYQDQRRIAAAVAWHRSLTGDDAAAFHDFDAA